jgi:hypothetical protein
MLLDLRRRDERARNLLGLRGYSIRRAGRAHGYRSRERTRGDREAAMTQICGWCKKELGEICPHCGSTAIPMLFRWRFFLRGFHGALQLLGLLIAYRRLLMGCMFQCTGVCLQVLFLKGLGGISHGVCPECKMKTRFAQSALGRGVC